MMTENAAPQLTEEDLTDFARQLYEWTKSLPDVQQGLLHRILTRAAGAQTDDTAGYALNAYLRLPQPAPFTGLVQAAIGPSFAFGDGSVRITDGTSNT
jgi:hypothetical protein